MRRIATRKKLRDLISEPKRLALAWVKVRAGANTNSCGVDGQTIASFANSAKSQIDKIRNEIRSDTYAFQSYRGVAISKCKNLPLQVGNARPISIATVRDRVVQRAIYDAIWPRIRDRICTRSSYGGVRSYLTKGGKSRTSDDERRNVRGAATEILKLRADGYGWVFETDIESFFPSIPRDRLFKDLQEKLQDNSIDYLIEGALDTSVANKDELRHLSDLWNPESGVPQGGVLSPALATFYLYELDLAMEERGFRMVRYVDDLVVLCKTEQDAHEAYDLCRNTLKGLDLKMHDLDVPSKSGRVKTRILPPCSPLEFLGLIFTDNKVRPVSDRLHRLCESIKFITNGKVLSALTFSDVLRRVNGSIRGWLASYQFCHFTKSELNEIDNHSRRYVAGWLEYHAIIKSWKSIDAAKAARLGLVSAARMPLSPILLSTPCATQEA